MKKLFILVTFFPMYLSIATSHEITVSHAMIERMEKEAAYEHFAWVMAQHESNHNTFAVGKDDDCGLYQITPICLRDFNQRTKKCYSREDLFNPTINREIFDFYCKGKPFEKAAREWNGGPNGMKKISTIKYWAKVHSLLTTI